MRFATNAVGSGDASDVVFVVLNLIRDLRSSEWHYCIHDVRKKIADKTSRFGSIRTLHSSYEEEAGCHHPIDG